jgi:hypothetical protein
VPSGAVGVQRVPALGTPAFSDAVAFQDKVGPAALAELGAHHQAGLAAADDQGFDFLDGHGAVLFRVGKTDARVARGDKLVRRAIVHRKAAGPPSASSGHNAPMAVVPGCIAVTREQTFANSQPAHRLPCDRASVPASMRSIAKEHVALAARLDCDSAGGRWTR